jgi:hypothetical protein
MFKRNYPAKGPLLEAINNPNNLIVLESFINEDIREYPIQTENEAGKFRLRCQPEDEASNSSESVLERTDAGQSMKRRLCVEELVVRRADGSNKTVS